MNRPFVKAGISLLACAMIFLSICGLSGCMTASSGVPVGDAGITCQITESSPVSFNPNMYGSIVKTAYDEKAGDVAFELRIRDDDSKEKLIEIASGALEEHALAELPLPSLDDANWLPSNLDLEQEVDAMQVEHCYHGTFAGETSPTDEVWMLFLKDGDGNDWLFFIEQGEK